MTTLRKATTSSAGLEVGRKSWAQWIFPLDFDESHPQGIENVGEQSVFVGGQVSACFLLEKSEKVNHPTRLRQRDCTGRFAFAEAMKCGRGKR